MKQSEKFTGHGGSTRQLHQKDTNEQLLYKKEIKERYIFLTDWNMLQCVITRCIDND